MTLCWFSEGSDSVSLSRIRQIPAVQGVASSIDSIPPGQILPAENIRALKAEVESAGLELLGIESVNVYDAIKVGSPERMRSNANGSSLPGWEPERLAKIEALFEMYAGIDGEGLLDNLIYFLKALMPACEAYGVNMAIHPDDPPRPWENDLGRAGPPRLRSI